MTNELTGRVIAEFGEPPAADRYVIQQLLQSTNTWQAIARTADRTEAVTIAEALAGPGQRLRVLDLSPELDEVEQ